MIKNFIEDIKKNILGELYAGLGGIPKIPDYVKGLGSFKTLPFNLIKDIFLCGKTIIVGDD